MVVNSVFIVILCVISVIDCMTKSIHDFMLIAGALLCYPLLVFMEAMPVSEIFRGAAWGFSSYGLIYLLTKKIYREEVFGQGDVLLNTFICGYLGLFPGIVSSCLTFFVALATVPIFALRRPSVAIKESVSRDPEIPLAPAMSVSALISLFYYREVIELVFGI